jgi:hypothetical protein
VCTALAKIQFPTEESMPQLGLLPLGTGNDLCGFLGWGTGYTGGDLYKIIERMNAAVPIKLDRWKVRIMETAILKGSKIISFKKKHTAPALHAAHSVSGAATPMASASSTVDHGALLRSAPPKMSTYHDQLRDSAASLSSSSTASSPPTSPPPQRRPHSPKPVRKLDFGGPDSKEEDEQEQAADGGGHRDSLAASPTKATGTSPRRGSPRKPLPQLPRSFSTMAAVGSHSNAGGARGEAAAPAMVPPLPSVTSAVLPTSPPSPSVVARNEAKRAAAQQQSDAEQLQFEESDENAVDEVHLHARELQYDQVATPGNGGTDHHAHTDSVGGDGVGSDASGQKMRSAPKAHSEENSTVLDVDWATVDDKRRRIENGDGDDDSDGDGEPGRDDSPRVDPDELATTPAGQHTDTDTDTDNDNDNDSNNDNNEQNGTNKEDEESATLSLKSFHHSFSLGVDAKISMAFHLAREANPDAFTSRGTVLCVRVRACVRSVSCRVVRTRAEANRPLSFLPFSQA